MSEVNGFGVLEIAADPLWEPMQIADVLEQDGVYSGIIVGEKATAADANKPGVWLTIELQDTDVAGKRLQKLLIDPRHNDKVMFLWRGLLMSIGGKDAARGAFSYTLGRFTGATCYFKVGAYMTGKGDVASGVNEWITKSDYEQAVNKKAHRWPRAVSAKSGDASAFGLPSGVPAGFGTPPKSESIAATTPVQSVAAPFVPAPNKNGFPAFPGLK